MMRALYLLVVLTGLLCGRISAQEAEQPAPADVPALPETQSEPAKSEDPQMNPETATDPENDGAILPDLDFSPRKKTENKSPNKKYSMKPPADAQDLEQRIRYRNAKTKALSNPAVQSAWDESRAAKTDFDRREALKRYYDAVYKEVVKLDKSLEKLAIERQSNLLGRLKQTRIDPTEPLGDENIGD